MNILAVKDVKLKRCLFEDSGHQSRVSMYVKYLAQGLKLSSGDIQDVTDAALMHDRGKEYVDYDILLKPDKLTRKEYEIVKYHVILSAAEALESGYNINVLRNIFFHHECYDGSGYPSGLIGNKIPIGSRIIKIADFYDALTNDRAYRKGMDHDSAIRIMTENLQQLDQRIFDMFVRSFDYMSKKECSI